MRALRRRYGYRTASGCKVLMNWRLQLKTEYIRAYIDTTLHTFMGCSSQYRSAARERKEPCLVRLCSLPWHAPASRIYSSSCGPDKQQKMH